MVVFCTPRKPWCPTWSTLRCTDWSWNDRADSMRDWQMPPGTESRLLSCKGFLSYLQGQSRQEEPMCGRGCLGIGPSQRSTETEQWAALSSLVIFTLSIMQLLVVQIHSLSKAMKVFLCNRQASTCKVFSILGKTWWKTSLIKWQLLGTQLVPRDHLSSYNQWDWFHLWALWLRVFQRQQLHYQVWPSYYCERWQMKSWQEWGSRTSWSLDSFWPASRLMENSSNPKFTVVSVSLFLELKNSLIDILMAQSHFVESVYLQLRWPSILSCPHKTSRKWEK